MQDLSVIVPTHNRRAFLPALLASLAAQNYPADRWELIIVDDGSSDGTRAYLETGTDPRPRQMRYIFQRQSGAATARNTGAQAATGRALLFLDDDMIAAPELIGEHALVHQRDPDAVVIGHLSVPGRRSEPWVAWEDAQMARHYGQLDSGARLPGPRDFFSGNCSVSTGLFHAIGGYNTTLVRTEDVELGYRLAAAGGTFYYRVHADSLHLGQHKFGGWVRNARVYGQADVKLGWEQGHNELRSDVFRWFHNRRRPNRTLVQLCSAHPWLEIPLIGVLHGFGQAAYRAGKQRPAFAAYSAIYNLVYWLALSQTLGREQFWNGVREAAPVAAGAGATHPAA